MTAERVQSTNPGEPWETVRRRWNSFRSAIS